ncbi:MAG: hypothetical protein WC453_02830 [Patescibacteria group bacterium]
MGLNILPKGGINFKTSTGAGNFKAKLNKLTHYQGGEFGMLRNNREAINKAISKRAGIIRMKGGLDRMQRKSALSEIIKSDKSLTKQDKYKVKELLDHYARGRKEDASSPEPVKPAVNRELDETKVTGRRPNFAHEADPNFFRQTAPINRGAAVSDAMKYQKMQRLGSGETARKLQEDAYARLQKSSGNLGPGGRRGSSLGPLKLNK